MLNPYRVNEHREAMAMARAFRTGDYPAMRVSYGREMAARWLFVAGEIRRNAWKPWDFEMRWWVCRCCMLSHANGECCDNPEHGGDGCEPLGLLSATDSVAMGGEHNCDRCYLDGDCDCQYHEFETSQCKGCGSHLHGSRYAMTVFVNDRRNTVNA